MKRSTIFIISFYHVFYSCMCSENDNNTFFSIRTSKTGPTPPWDETYLDKLRKDLLTNYDKYARPAQHDDVTAVKVGLTVTYLETDELNSTISVSGWLKLNWIDPKLKWQKDDYGDITAVKMADHEIWQPDVYLYNSALGSESVSHYGNPYAIVYSNGEVTFVPPSRFRAVCEFDLYYWPFDTQRCSLRFRSWTDSGMQIRSELYGSNPTEILLSSPISTWEVNVTGKAINMISNCCQNRFNIRFDLVLKRKSSAYIAVVVTPIIVIISLILVQCSLPASGGQKVILNSSTALMVTILLSYFMQKVFHTGTHTPWIISFYSTCLCMSCISMVESIFVLLILRTDQKQSLPRIIKKLLEGRMGKLLCLENVVSEYYASSKHQKAEELKDYHLSEHENDMIIKSTSKDLIQEEWEIFTVAFDRILFIIYCFIFLILILCYII